MARFDTLTRVSDGTTLKADLDRGISLPASWYTDPALMDRERERIFRRAWQYVGHAEQVPCVGDFFACVVADVPVVVVRSEAGLRAFVNVCRHRRHLVASGSGNRRTLQCPYHAWTYDLGGRLRAAPRAQHEAGFELDDYPLLPVALDTWGPFLFVNLDVGARALANDLGQLPSIVAGSGLVLEELRFHDREEWRAEANWKVMIENFLECYHCPVQHPGFSTVVDVDEDAYALEAHGSFSSQVAPVRRSALEGGGRKPAYDVRGAVTQAQYHHLWPNFTLSINPGHPNLSLDVFVPLGPERTGGFSEHWFGADVPERARREMIDFNRQVSGEDDRLTDSVQRGLRAGVPARGRFLTRSEHLIVHFQKLVIDALL
jgi:phenylpropionate dioxygenase-like ring-hydroxylating dioxygenase large terminal subunit